MILKRVVYVKFLEMKKENFRVSSYINFAIEKLC